MNETNWNDLMAAAAAVLGLTPAVFEEEFKRLTRITTVEDIDDDDVFKFGDFREIYKSLPVPVLRKVFKALRGGKSTDKQTPGGEGTDPRIQELKALGFKTRLEDADPAILLKYYLPDKPADPISTALKKRFGDKPLIAFKDDGTVALTETLQYLADLEQHYPEQETITVDGKLAKLWPIGAKPDTMVEEDPLFPGQPLRNGYSLVNHRNWTKVSMENRQMCRIILERGEIDPDNKEAVLRFLERAETKDGLNAAYPEAELEFREKKKKDELPKLKVQLGAAGTKPNNPFGVRRQY
jgi:hypothetical protein